MAKERRTGGQRIARQVVIRYDRLHAELLAALKLRVRLHAVVHRHDQLHALRRKPFHGGEVHAVAFRMA